MPVTGVLINNETNTAEGGCHVRVMAESGGMQPHAKQSEVAGKPPEAGEEAWDRQNQP